MLIFSLKDKSKNKKYIQKKKEKKYHYFSYDVRNLKINPFILQFLKWALLSLNLDMSIDKN